MNELDDTNELEDGEELPSKVNKKKIIIFLLPALIAIGLAVGMYHTFGSSVKDVEGQPYRILEQEAGEGKSEKQTLIFYNFPTISVPLRNASGTKDMVNIKLSLELADKNDIPKIEILLPRLYDLILTHTRELTIEEISGAEGLYWLKEELLYRINLAVAPIKISNIDFKDFDIQKE